MIKTLKSWGSGLAIYFDTKEIELLGLKEGDKVDLSDIFLIQAKNLKRMPKEKSNKIMLDKIKKEIGQSDTGKSS